MNRHVFRLIVRRSSSSSEWDRAADAYDATFAPKFRSYALEAIQASGILSERNIPRLPPALLAKKRILDVGAGSGALAILAAQQGLSVLATDYSTAMIDRLKGRADKELDADARSRLSTLVMDGQNLDLPDDAFDAVFSMFALIFFPDRNKGFKEILRTLKPGSVAVIGAWDIPQNIDWIRRSNKSLLTVKSDLPRPGPNDPPPPVFSLSDKLLFEKEMKDAGFQDVRIQPVQKIFPVPNPGQFWDGMSVGFPALAETLDKYFNDHERLRVREEFVRLCLDEATQKKTFPKVKGTCLLGIGMKKAKQMETSQKLT